MKTAFRFSLLVSALLLGVAAAHATPVATFACSSSSGGATPILANVSYFDLGVSGTTNIGSQTGGAGAGKITFKPLVLHTALSSFFSFLNATTLGTAFDQCILKMSMPNGGSVQYNLKLVAVQSVDAVAQSPRLITDEPAAFCLVNLIFGSVTVQTSSTIDDGGTNGGWNQVASTSN